MDKFAKIKEFMKTRYKLIDSGSYRHVYDAEYYVIKIPVDRSAELDNYGEHDTYQRNKESGKYAKCWITTIDDIPIIFMEKVRIIPLDLKNPCNNLPDWCSEIDCCQVGYDCNENIVAYDYYNRMQESLHDGEEKFDLRLEEFKKSYSNYCIIPEPKVIKIMDNIKFLYERDNL